jgi:hypothetical protein
MLIVYVHYQYKEYVIMLALPACVAEWGLPSFFGSNKVDQRQICLAKVLLPINKNINLINIKKINSMKLIHLKHKWRFSSCLLNPMVQAVQIFNSSNCLKLQNISKRFK